VYHPHRIHRLNRELPMLYKNFFFCDESKELDIMANWPSTSMGEKVERNCENLTNTPEKFIFFAGDY
jgi:hypothetical protein